MESWHKAGNIQKATEELLSDADSADKRAASQKAAKAPKKK